VPTKMGVIQGVCDKGVFTPVRPSYDFLYLKYFITNRGDPDVIREIVA